MLVSVKKAIDNLKKQKPIIIFDKENENEGDLVIPSEIITIDILNFMLNKCKGVICQTLSQERIEEYDIPLLPLRGGNKTGQTNFACPVDHKNSETGISSKDRLMVIKELLKNDIDPDSLVIPGHQHVLKISTGGLLTRQGHTESSSYIVKLAGYIESAVICEIIDTNGVPMRYDTIISFSKENNIDVVLLSDIYKHFLTSVKIEPRVINFKNPYSLLNNKNVILTGGSSGIGKVLKGKLTGFNCGVTDLSRLYGHDITDFKHIKSIVNSIQCVDILINCAGYIQPSSIETTTLEEWNKHINTNVTAPFYLISQLIPKFKNDGGVIINVSSPSARKVRSGWSGYCCSKAALNSFTLNCADELIEKNIKVNAVSPSKTDTPMIHKLFTISKDKLIDPHIVSNFIIDIICSSYKYNTHGNIYEISKN